MLHGTIAWLVAVPLILLAAAVGGSSYLGSWYSGLTTRGWAAAPAQPPAPAPEDSDEGRRLAAQRKADAQVARNAALGAVTALLIGLMGSVLGGWMASGEPMTLHHHFRREPRRATVCNGLPIERGKTVTTESTNRPNEVPFFIQRQQDSQKE
jgi:hypothetical protein